MNNFNEFDLQCMQRAIALANFAAESNEVPVGAVLVDNQTQNIIGEGYNQPISSHDPTAHAEIVALRNAAQHVQNYRLIDTTLYVTLEPCAMCAGAILHARIKRLVFAAPDPKAGAIGGAMDLYSAHSWNHSVICQHGLLADVSAEILRSFFKARR